MHIATGMFTRVSQVFAGTTSVTPPGGLQPCQVAAKGRGKGSWGWGAPGAVRGTRGGAGKGRYVFTCESVCKCVCEYMCESVGESGSLLGACLGPS